MISLDFKFFFLSFDQVFKYNNRGGLPPDKKNCFEQRASLLPFIKKIPRPIVAKPPQEKLENLTVKTERRYQF